MRATSQAQPNIALIKYWGKRNVDNNLPATGSLSLTLDSLWTRMSIEFAERPGPDELLVNGVAEAGMLARVGRCLDDIAGSDRPDWRAPPAAHPALRRAPCTRVSLNFPSTTTISICRRWRCRMTGHWR